MKSTNVINEIQSKCRICLCENIDVIDIYSIDDNCGKISSAVMECSSVHIGSDDQLPTIICKNCLEKLRDAYAFRQLCRLSDQTLRQYINYIINRSTTEVLINNILITNNHHTTATTTTTTTVAQLICETTPPVILKSTDKNIIINTTQNDRSTTQQLQTDESVMEQLQNDDIPTILTQTINNNNCDIMNMPIMLNVRETNANNEFTRSIQQVHEVNDVSLSSSTFEQANLVDQILSLEENRNSVIKTKFTCRYCNKNYETNQQLARHETTTHGERKFMCNICEQKFTEKSVLKSHMMAKHTNERPYKCEFCIKSYVSRSHLRTHLRLHTGELPYKCETCEKCFASINVYKKHIKIHSTLRPYHCKKCPLTFTRLELLRCHLTRIHNDDEDNDMASVSEDTFIKTNIFNYEECKICKKKFKRKELLRRHSRTHTNDKKHKCTECMESFIRRWDLKRHLIMHKRLVIGPQNVSDVSV